MSIPTTIESLSTTAASNGPAGSDDRSTADDGLRQAYAFIKQSVSLGSNIASASTITPPSTGSVFNITGTTSITTIASTNSWDGRIVTFIFAGALTLTHSSNLALPGSTNITTVANDIATFVQTASGAWRCSNYVSSSGVPTSGTYTPTITNASGITSSTPNTTYWMRINNTIHISGTIYLTRTTASTAMLFYMTMPGGLSAISATGVISCYDTNYTTAQSGTGGFDSVDTGRPVGTVQPGTQNGASMPFAFSFFATV